MKGAIDLLGVVSEKINQITAIEKRLSKFYAKLEKNVDNPELSKALSAGETNVLQHLQRLKLISRSVEPQEAVKAEPSLLTLVQFKLNKKGKTKDLQTVFQVLELQNLKLAHYEFLHPIVLKLGRDLEAGLIEQTITENRNTNTWLRQILQNVIVPALR